MKKILNYIIAAIIAVPTLSGCSKFDSINTNPDATETVNASMLATNIILMNIKFNGRDAMAYLDGNGLAKYIAFANQSIMPSQYNQIGATGFGAMTILPNIESMLTYAKGSIMEDSYKGLAKFSEAYMFYNLTMQVGDIPYSEAGLGRTGAITPKYDTQEEIFKGILDDLKEADAYFAVGQRFDGDPTPYAGDPAKWRRATNAFALRVLMSLSKKENIESLNVKSRFAEIVNSGNLLQPTTGFLGLNYSTINMHPMSGTNDLFTSRTIVSSLVVDNLKQMNDRRLFYFADPSLAKLANGSTESDFNAYVGANVSENYDDITAAHSTNTYSLLNSRYLKEQTSEPRRMITYAEQQLILAEAVIRGWITGDAKTYYESGVKAALADVMATKASYAHGMAITQSYIDNYFTGEAAFKETTEDQLKQIWMQKYLMNFMMDTFTAYTEYRRTGYPEFPINAETSLNLTDKNSIPMRWLYPSSEYNYNRENLINALDRQYGGVDDINKIMWVLK
jgi:hypothetical protein